MNISATRGTTMYIFYRGIYRARPDASMNFIYDIRVIATHHYSELFVVYYIVLSRA